jgi:subtilisin family serine protease
MKKIAILFSIICLMSQFMFGQSSLDIDLIRYLKTADPDEIVNLLVQGDVQSIENEVAEADGLYKYAYGDIAAVRIKAGHIKTMAANPGIKSMTRAVGKIVLLNDYVRRNNNVDSVRNGLGNLPKGYKGKGVIMGVLDTGIEIEHPDFWNPDSTTRILHIWDQNKPVGSNTPSRYGYGQEWDSSEINNRTTTHKDDHSHGTRVSGIAAGNGRTDSTYMGVAPEADIIFVAIAFNNNFLTNVADGVDYIFRYADQYNKPCVINASLGTYFGSHDGQDVTAKVIDNMLLKKNGRSFVCAVGNGGDKFIHLGYEITSDTNFTWFKYYNSIGYAYFQLWSDTVDFNRVWFQVGCEKPGTFETRGETDFINIQKNFKLAGGPDIYSDTLKNDKGQRIAIVDVYAAKSGDSYMLDVVVTPDSTGYNYRFSTTGKGRLDAWSDPTLTGTSQFLRNNLPDASTYPKIVYYKKTDNQQSMVSSWACSPHVVTIGGYYNRDTFVAYNNSIHRFGFTVGSFAPFSSFGPTRKGLLKPDVVASGPPALSPSTIDKLNYYKQNAPGLLSKDGWHLHVGGTSSASPAAAGVIALYLERYPDASADEIIRALHLTAVSDTFTGPFLPDNKWGFGKLNAMRFVNIRKGCMDSTALNYDPLALIGNDSCRYDSSVGISALYNEIGISVFPNPFRGNTTIMINGVPSNQTGLGIEVVDIFGRIIMRIRFTKNRTQYVLEQGDLNAGIYILRLTDNNRTIGTKKLIIY